MAIPLTINGAVFEYPQDFDVEWGVDATGWAQAVTAGALYLSGGSFPLTNMVDFGSSFGIKVKSVASKTTNPATAGYLLLAKSDAIEWRNNANSANLVLAIDGSDNLTFNGTPLGTTSLTNGDIFVGNASNVPVAVALSGDATITNTGVLTISNGAITNAKVSASAAIATSKLAPLTVSRAVQTDAGGLLAVSAVTGTELGYLSGVTGPIQTQLATYLPLAGGTMTGAIAMGSNKITSLAQGTATGNAITWDQLPAQSGTITNFVSYSPGIGGFSGVTVSAWWRRVGDSLEARLYANASTLTASIVVIDLPAGLAINAATTGTRTNSVIVGFGAGLSNTTTTLGQVFFDGSDVTHVYFTTGADTTNQQYVKRTATNMFGSIATTLTVYFTVPIATWSI